MLVSLYFPNKFISLKRITGMWQDLEMEWVRVRILLFSNAWPQAEIRLCWDFFGSGNHSSLKCYAITATSDVGSTLNSEPESPNNEETAQTETEAEAEAEADTDTEEKDLNTVIMIIIPLVLTIVISVIVCVVIICRKWRIKDGMSVIN